jgi:hypothetical protein
MVSISDFASVRQDVLFYPQVEAWQFMVSLHRSRKTGNWIIIQASNGPVPGIKAKPLYGLSPPSSHLLSMYHDSHLIITS